MRVPWESVPFTRGRWSRRRATERSVHVYNIGTSGRRRRQRHCVHVCRDFRPCTNKRRRCIIAGSRVRRGEKEIRNIYARRTRRIYIYIYIVATYDPRLSRRRQPPLPNRQLDRFGGRAGARRRRSAQPLWTLDSDSSHCGGTIAGTAAAETV